MIEGLVHVGVGRLVMRLKLPMLDQRSLPPRSQPVAMGLVIIALVCCQHLELLQVPLGQLRSDPGVMLAGGGDVNV
jgi:hypothetical protein